MVETLDKQLENINNEEKVIHKLIDERNKKREINCESCDKSHKIKDLTLIQTHWYKEPRGHNEGAYWNEGEMQFICPETNVINRFLFDNYDVPYEKRELYENNPEEQFKRLYKHLFKEVLDRHEKTEDQSLNNYYVDENRKKFGLVERKRIY